MITHERLTHLLDYDPETGVFSWRNPPNGCLKGARAGTRLGVNYRQIMLDREKYTGHRLAWFYMTKEWPPEGVDHKRHERGDAFDNLRLASTKQNSWNVAPKHGHSKWKGVTYDKGRRKCWKMVFTAPDGLKVQQRFEDEREAAEEYMFLALEHHGEFARLE